MQHPVRRRAFRLAATSAAVAASVFAVACGGDDEPAGGGGGGGSASGGGESILSDPARNAPAVDPNAANNAQGEVTFCLGGALAGHNEVIRAFNRQGGARVRLLTLPASADEQRQQQIRRLEARSGDCDVLAMDVIWTAEYANQGWLQDVGPLLQQRQGEFIQSTVDSATYGGKTWGVPYNSNAGFLYYRTDAVQQAPRTWQEVYQQAGEADGIVFQGARYEGLTVNFLELLYSAGGNVLNEDGTQATADSQQVRDVLTFMRQGIESGATPRAVTTYMEDQTLQNFVNKRSTFARNWPYQYNELEDQQGEFEITAFPAFGQGEGAGVLGGFNLGISAYTDNPGAALAFVNFASSPEAQELLATEGALPPVLTEVYERPAVQRALPFADDLRQAITQARPRPVSPVYTQISQAIYENAHDALTGQATPDAAASAMNQEIQRALETF